VSRWQQHSKLILSNNLSQHHRAEGNDINVRECASDGEPQDYVSRGGASINITTSTIPDDSIPQTQDCFIVAGGTAQDNDKNSHVVDNNDNCMSCQSRLLIYNVVMPCSSSTVTYAMLKLVACELAKDVMKQNDTMKKLSVYGTVLWVTNLLKGNDSLRRPGFNEAIEQYLVHSFLYIFPASFLEGIFQIRRTKHLNLFLAMDVQQQSDTCHKKKLSVILHDGAS
jgi:hypothetical protein